MQQDFVTQLKQVCQRRRWRRTWTATCWFVAAVLALALVLVAADRVLCIVDPVGRGLLTIVFLALSVRIWRLAFSDVLSDPTTPLQVAQEVESRYPKLRGLIASGWEFAQQEDGDPSTGSDSLRRAVVLQASTALDDVSWAQFVPREPLRQATFALLGVGLIVGVLGWCLPQAMAAGFSRLVNPLSDTEWPRDFDLAFVDTPRQLIAGDDLVLQLLNSQGTLPSTVTMHYRVRNQGRWQEQSQNLAAGKELLDIRRANVRRSLQYRATGGDHLTMPWLPLGVVPQPRIQSLKVIIHPPAYTNLPASQLNESRPIYRGSTAELHGKLDLAVEEIVLESSSGHRLPTRLSSDSRSFKVDRSQWKLVRSDSFRLKATTAAGLSTYVGDELSVEVVEDQPPQVRIVEPANDVDVLPSVTIPLTVEAADELSVREIDLVYQRSDRSTDGAQKIAVWRDQSDETNTLRKCQVEFAWELEPLQLVPGALIELHAQARDAQPAIGQTIRALRLHIVSESQLWGKLLEQQAHLVERMARLLSEQRELRTKTDIWSDNPAWSPARWETASHAALFQQRQIADLIAGGQDSVLGQLEVIFESIERNQLPQTEVVDRLLAARDLVQSMTSGALQQVQHVMNELTRQMRRSPDENTDSRLITLTARYQDEVLIGLQDAIDLLTPTNTLGRLERELAEIELNQKELSRHCQMELAPQSFQSTELTSVVQTKLEAAVRRQRTISRQLGEWNFDLSQRADQFAAQQPGLSDRLRETTALLQHLGTQATMQAAANQLARGRYGRSSSLQIQALSDLARLRTHLSGLDVPGASERLRELQTTERKLWQLRKELADFTRELRGLTPERRGIEQQQLRQDQQDFAEQIEAIVRQLEKLRMERAAESARQAVRDLRKNTLELASIQQAQRKLDEVQRQLTDARRRKQVALARLEMSRLGTKLEDWISHQQTIQREIADFQPKIDSHQYSAESQKRMEQLAKSQSNLSSEVLEHAGKLTSVPVFAYLLKTAGNTMIDIEQQLERHESALSQKLSAQVTQQLQQLASTLLQEQQNLSASNRLAGSEGQGGTADNAEQQTIQLALGQMSLLRSLQDALRTETLELENRRTGIQPLSKLAQKLADRQQQLAELASQLVSEPILPAEEDLWPELDKEKSP